MDPVLLNILSALSIGVMIFIMSLLKSGYIKALVYSLPIPITLALVATGGTIDETNVTGLLLVCGFLWMVWALNKAGINLYVADIVSAITYVGVGFIAVTYLAISFQLAVAIYAIVWGVFVWRYKHVVQNSKVKNVRHLNPFVKLPIVSTIAYVLLNFKSFLAGVIVTFPFSGVFAVLESRNTLRTLAATFTRNSFAILIFFITIYLLSDQLLAVRILVGWCVYLVALFAISKLIRYEH
jgi:hypothetical protein